MCLHLGSLLRKSKAKQNCCILQMITFCLFLGVCVSKRGNTQAYIPTNPSQSLFPWSFLLLSLTKLLLQTACISQTVDLYVFTLLRLPSHLSVLCFFSPPSSSPHLYPPLSLSACFCISNCCSNFTNMRVGRKFKKAQAPESLGVSPSCCWSSGMHLFH